MAPVIVLIPERDKWVAAMPPITSRVVDGMVEPIPIRLFELSANRRLVLTCRPFLTTKFL